jgi:hypothetical protein
LVADIVDLEHTDARAVIDGRELIEASFGARDSLEEFHVDLQAMSGLWLLVSMPGTTCRLALLVDRQPVHSIADEYSMNGRTCHIHVVKAMQIAGDPSWSESVTLSQIQNLGDNRARRGPRRVKRCAGPIAQTTLTVALVSRSPFVEGLARKAEASAGLGDAPGHVAGLPQQLQPPGNHSVLFVLVHGSLLV